MIFSQSSRVYGMNVGTRLGQVLAKQVKISSSSSSSSPFHQRIQARTSSTRVSSRLLSTTSSSDSSGSNTSNTTTSSSSSNLTVPRKFVPFPFEYHQELTVRVESLTNIGVGVCRITLTHEQQQRLHRPTDPTDTDSTNPTNTTTPPWVIFVPNTIPEELVRVKVYRNYNTFSEADLVEVLEPSIHRVEPMCPLAMKCGGCQYQHISIESQRDNKMKQVQELLVRSGGFDAVTIMNGLVRPTVGTDQIWNYRSKITPHYEAPKKISKDVYEIGNIGFKEKSSKRLLDVPYCFIATDAINTKLRDYRIERREEAASGKLKRVTKGATLLLRDADEGVVTDHNVYVTTKVAGLVFRFMAGNFFQNNPYMLPVLVQHVVEAATKLNAKGEAMTHFIDCYCGSGLFGLASARQFKQCVGIEVNENAIEEAKINAQLNGIDNCAFVAASAEAIFNPRTPISSNNNADDDTMWLSVQDFPRETTVVALDPPRKGCSPEFLEQLFDYGPARVVYMSCEPLTQARDVKSIVAAGYTMTSVQPFDLFPQTRHIECLIVLERDN